jgi:hypothetical protein
MNNQPESAKVHRQIGAAEVFIDARLALGRVAFAMNNSFIDTARVLLENLPVIFEAPHFAMKGGTAINLFVQGMPRLSVDVDVVYTDCTTPRPAALKAISDGLNQARTRLVKFGMDAQVAATNKGDEIKLFIQRRKILVKVEVNHVFRGTVLPVDTLWYPVNSHLPFAGQCQLTISCLLGGVVMVLLK